MREFRLPEPVDLVICEFDALNHVPLKSDLDPVVRSVARALRPGGHFYFDVNTKLSFQKLWPGTWFVEAPGVAVAMSGGYDRSRDVAWTRIAGFVRAGNLWRRHNERIEEVCWTDRELRGALHAAGFGRVRSWDVAKFVKNGPLKQAGLRKFYLAHKRER
jgi:SAM-dependent methyltransferase